MKTYLQKSVFTVLAVLLYSNAFSQFTRNQAIDLVMNDILGADTTNLHVFASLGQKIQQEEVVLLDNRTISCPYTANWVFFVDDNPNLFWYHPCRYILVSSQNGDYSIVDSDLFPNDLETEYEMITSVPELDPINLPSYTESTASTEEVNDHLFAVLIGGTPQSSFWTDISMIYNTLLEKGYKKENVFVHFSDADGSYGQGGIYNDDLDGDLIEDDIDYDVSLSSLYTTFENLSGISTSNSEIPKLGKDDQLLVHFDSHGDSYDLENKGSFILVNGSNGPEFLYDYQLAELMEPLECAQVLVTMQQCFSGGFIDDLIDYPTYPNTKCKNRIIITAADYDETSHMEVYITGGTGLIGGVYGEFTFYLYSALRGFYPDVNFDNDIHPWEHSYNLGEFPFYLYSAMLDHPDDYDPDEILGNNDGIVQIGEGFLYMNDFNTYSPYGYYYSGITDFPQNEKTGLFIEDLFTLKGLTGDVNNTQEVTGNFLLGGDISIGSSANVTVSEGNFYLMNTADIKVNAGSSLVLGDDISITSMQGEDKLVVEGDITVGDNVQFIALEEATLSVELDNPYMNAIFENTTFTNCMLDSKIENLTVKKSTFEECPNMQSHKGTVLLENNVFNKTGVLLENISSGIPTNPLTATILNNTFSDKATIAIELLAYDFYNISGNTINDFNIGIQVSNCGYGKEYKIWNNEVSASSEKGILVYNSIADIYNNYIHNNGVLGTSGGHGIWLGDHSSTQLRGDETAHHNTQTQRIIDNEGYEVFIAYHSFPKDFHYNIIIDEDNGADNQLVYYDDDTGDINLKDVKYNCWGEEFEPTEDLYPSYYIWDPTWCPPLGGIGGKEGAALLYSNAEDQFKAEDYNGAKVTYKMVIDQYPDTKYAIASIQSLFALEKFDTDDYNTLKDYYANNTTIQASPKLVEESEFVTSKCDVKLENWAEAILYFEGRLNAPQNLQDSIFATIDLGHIYTIMSEGENKSSYQGKLIEYIPVSKEAHLKNQEYLLGLLPKTSMSQSMKENLINLKEGELLQNVPNPFTDKTQLWYKVQSDAKVRIKVYNYTGQVIRTFEEGTQTKGTHFVDMDARELPSGMYFYSITVNGKSTDSKKMTLMK